MHCHMTSTHIAESAHTRNRAIVTRPFSLAEGWGLETRLYLRVPFHPGYTCTYMYVRTCVQFSLLFDIREMMAASCSLAVHFFSDLYRQSLLCFVTAVHVT